MTDRQKIIERLAEFMKDVWYENAEIKAGVIVKNGEGVTAWGLWRDVEEKMMEDEDIWFDFRQKFVSNIKAHLAFYMKADLPTRCKTLVSILQKNND